MRSGRRVSLGVVICLVAAGVATPVGAQQRSAREAGVAPATEAAPPSGDLPSADLPGSDGLGTDDDASAGTVAATPTRGALSPELATRLNRSGSSLVEVSGADASIAAAIRRSGGSLRGGGNGVYLANVPNSSLRTLGGSAGIQSVAVPMDVESARSVVPSVENGQVERGPVTGQNVAAIAPWHAAGLRGAGSKVGLIALFDPATLAAEISSGELPAIPAGNTTCISAAAVCPFGTVGQTWGNSLAEIISDGAPDATLYLAELGYRTDYYKVIDWMASKGVTILVNPIVWTYDGPGNGTGPSAAIVDYAVSKGIAWFNTAGELGFNYGTSGTYWRGTWSDTDNDKWLNFKGTDESLTVYCGLLLGMRWSDWGKVPTDYDLYISDYRANNGTYGTKKIASGYNQSVAGAQPVEATFGIRLCNSNAANGPVYDTNGDGYVSLYVQRNTRTADSPVGDVIEIGTYYGYMERSTYEGSVGIAFADSANPGMLTVGGDMFNVAQGWPGSGYGPTNDGRVKPDIATIICYRTSLETGDDRCSNGGYYGTDASAASLAGWAAAAAPVLGATSPAQIALYMRDLGRVNGAPLPNPINSVGYGLATMPAPPPTSYPSTVYQPVTPFRLIDTRPQAPGQVGVPLDRRVRKGETLHVRTIPTSGVTAFVINVAMVKASGKGFLSVQPAGWSIPAAVSSVNTDAAGQTRANMLIVPVGDAGYIDIYSSVETDVLVDVLGYFSPPPVVSSQNSETGHFVAVTPHRVLDSRSCLAVASCTGAPRPAGSWTPLTVWGVEDPVDPANDVPLDAVGAVLAVTVDQPAANGFLSVTPGNVSVVATSNLNFQAGRSATITAIVPINGNANGAVKVYISTAAHVQVDLLGYFSGAGESGDPAGLYVPVQPRRQLDTRLPTGTPAVAAGTTLTVTTASAAVPADASAVFLNNAAINTAGPGETQVAATNPSLPAGFRNLTSGATGQVIAASTLTALDAGTYTLTSNYTGHFVSDLSGYFTALPEPVRELQPLAGPTSVRAMSADAEVLVGIEGRFVKVFRQSTGITQTIEFDNIYTEARVDIDDAGTVLIIDATRYAGGGGSTETYIIDLTEPVSYDYVTQLDGAATHTGSYQVSMSGDGRFVAFFTGDSIDPADTTPNSNDLYILDRTSGTYRLVAGMGPNVANVSFSEDGSTLAWTTTVSPYTSDTLHSLDLATNGTQSVSLGVRARDLLLSSNGSVAVAMHALQIYGTSYELLRVDLAAGSVTSAPIPAVLQTFWGRYGGFFYDPAIALSADGSTIALSGSGYRGLYLITTNGQIVERIDRTAVGLLPNGYVGEVLLSPGFDRIVFRSTSKNLLADQDPNVTLYLVNRTS